MKKQILTKLDLTLYSETLPNGLTIYVIPKKGNNIYATFTAKYGSKINEFVPAGQKKMMKVPDGIAHFLEHKLFENQNEEDPFTYFGARGADANASTTSDKTTYLFAGTSSFEENLNYLLDFVQSPYFTEESVEKEKDIIKEEILMYEDNPFSRLYEKSLYNTFQKNPVRIPVPGTVKSIYKITKDMLHMCYDTFYQPSNMFVVVTGNVDAHHTIECIRKNQASKQFAPVSLLDVKKYDEPDSVFKEKEILYMNVSIPKFSVNIKINYKNIKGYSKYLIRVALFQYFSNKFGITSLFAEKLKEEGLILEDFGINMMNAGSHFVFMILGESNDPNLVMDKIKKELKKITFEEEDLMRKKKVLISSYIYMSDNIYSLNNKVMSNIINYGEVIEDDKELASLTPEVVQTMIKKIDFTNISTVQIEKEEKE